MDRGLFLILSKRFSAHLVILLTVCYIESILGLQKRSWAGTIHRRLRSCKFANDFVCFGGLAGTKPAELFPEGCPMLVVESVPYLRTNMESTYLSLRSCTQLLHIYISKDVSFVIGTSLTLGVGTDMKRYDRKIDHVKVGGAIHLHSSQYNNPFADLLGICQLWVRGQPHHFCCGAAWSSCQRYLWSQKSAEQFPKGWYRICARQTVPIVSLMKASKKGLSRGLFHVWQKYLECPHQSRPPDRDKFPGWWLISTVRHLNLERIWTAVPSFQDLHGLCEDVSTRDF